MYSCSLSFTFFRFRLSPEEQEIAYELKASMFRKLEEQNSKVQDELQLHNNLQASKAQRSSSAKAYHNQVEMSRSNALKLMKLYEKQAVACTLKEKPCFMS